MAKKIRLGLIGCGGNMRNAHVPRFKNHPGLVLAAVCDPFEDALKLIVEKYGSPVPSFTDFRKMLNTVELDAVMISTPHNQHFAQAKMALEKGLHVLVEKPLVIESKHAKALLALAKKKKKILHVSYQRHHTAVYRHLRALVASGTIGKIQSFTGYVTQNWIRAGGWRKDPVQSGGGMFMDTGSHLVASTMFLTGLEPLSVTAVVDNCGEPVDINAVVAIRCKGGALGNLTTIGSALLHDEVLTIHGDKGTLGLHQHQWKALEIWLNGQILEIPKNVPNDTPDVSFLQWVIGKNLKAYEAPIYALQVARLSEAVYASAKKGKTIKVKS
ncbi:MAG TPA: Gfo/Idh/MocA family oxidoreductase [Planctomycetota bacterium]|nr:Gfo/Idh/MocA family oxidoreductase [Planctomycetota bacterium]